MDVTRKVSSWIPNMFDRKNLFSLDVPLELKKFPKKIESYFLYICPGSFITVMMDDRDNLYIKFGDQKEYNSDVYYPMIRKGYSGNYGKGFAASYCNPWDCCPDIDITVHGRYDMLSMEINQSVYFFKRNFDYLREEKATGYIALPSQVKRLGHVLQVPERDRFFVLVHDAFPEEYTEPSIHLMSLEEGILLTYKVHGYMVMRDGGTTSAILEDEHGKKEELLIPSVFKSNAPTFAKHVVLLPVEDPKVILGLAHKGNFILEPNEKKKLEEKIR